MAPDERNPRILPLVGRVIKKRLLAFGRQARRELSAGYAQFRRELEAELREATQEADAARSTARTTSSSGPDGARGDTATETTPDRVRVEP